MIHIEPRVVDFLSLDETEKDKFLQARGDDIRKGHLIVFPTETVYGLGANALDPDAVSRIYEAKKRPFCDPIICHVSYPDEAFTLFSENENPIVLFVLKVFARTFWPGPLSLVATASNTVPKEVMGGSTFVSVRCPNHPIALNLIKAAGVPIAAPSANLFGHISPSLATHAENDFRCIDLNSTSLDYNQQALYIIDGGGCQVGIESTVCKIEMDNTNSVVKITILRRGYISAAMLKAALVDQTNDFKDNFGSDVAVLITNLSIKVLDRFEPLKERPNRDTADLCSINSTPLDSPGVLLSHYAPLFPTYLLSRSPEGVKRYCIQRHDKDGVRVCLTLKSCILIDSFNLFQDISDKVGRYFSLSRISDSNQVGYAMQQVLFKRLHEAEYAALCLLKKNNNKEEAQQPFICIADFYTTASTLGESTLAVYDRLFRFDLM